jgi:esterase/lipase
MEWLENSGHILTEDLERDRVYHQIHCWILQHAPAA